jgi:hypothetical protein
VSPFLLLVWPLWVLRFLVLRGSMLLELMLGG